MRRCTAASLALLCLAVFLAAAHGATILPQPGDVEGCQQAEPPQLVRCAHKPISAFVPNCPFEQVHVSLGVFDPATGTWNATFGWASLKPQSGAPDRIPLVRVAASKAALKKGGCVVTAKGTTVNYTITTPYWTEFTTKDNWHYNSPPLHHASVRALKPQTRYYYQVGRAGLFRDSIFSFRTPNAPGTSVTVGARASLDADQPNPPPLTIYTIGDIGQTANSLSTRDLVLDRYARRAGEGFALIIGDLAYADGGADRWDSFARLMEPLAASMPLMVLPGNHEIEEDNTTLQTFLPYRHRYVMPAALPEKTAPIRPAAWHGRPVAEISYEGGSSFYSFEVGFVHILMLNTYDTHGGLSGDNAQRRFAEADLAGVDRARTPFVLVFTHGPMYNNNAGHQDEPETMIMKAWLEPLVNQYKVDCVLAGHVHAYERMHGIAPGGRLSRAAPMYITVGDGGNHERLYPDWVSPLPPTSAYHDGHFYGHGEITVFNRTHMLWSWVPNPAQAGELPYDTYWIAPRGPAYGSRKEQVIAVPFAGAALAGAVLLLAACCCCCCAGRCAALCRRRARQGTEREGLLGEG